MGGTLRPYATEIAAAWLVLEALWSRGFLCSVRRGPCGRWKCRATDRERRIQVDELGTTAARAICATALKVQREHALRDPVPA